MAPGGSSSMSWGLKRAYLSLYNWAMFFGWLQVFFLALTTLMKSGHRDVYGAVERPLQIVHTAAVMEILHGLVGLVRSPVSATLPQIGSRLYVNWGIMWSFPEAQHQEDMGSSSVTTMVRTHVFVTILVMVSSLTEIIRYSFFGMKEAFGFAPSWLLWLRYSTFLVMYPPGITSEIGIIYNALPFMKASGKYCVRLPNKWNFSFDYSYAAMLALGIFVPCSPHMYMYMLGQRKRALSKPKAA